MSDTEDRCSHSQASLLRKVVSVSVLYPILPWSRPACWAVGEEAGMGEVICPKVA